MYMGYIMYIQLEQVQQKWSSLTACILPTKGNAVLFSMIYYLHEATMQTFGGFSPFTTADAASKWDFIAICELITTEVTIYQTIILQ